MSATSARAAWARRSSTCPIRPPAARRAVARAAGNAHAQGAGRRRAAAREPGAVPRRRRVTRPGWSVYDVATDPLAPRPIGRFESGGLGVHRIVWTGGRYAHASATPAGLRRPDLDRDRPGRSRAAGRGGALVLDEPQPEGERYAAHHALLDGDVAYLGYDDAGMVVLDVSRPDAPRKLARLDWQPAATRTRACRCPAAGSSSSPTSRCRRPRRAHRGSSASSTSPTRRRRGSSGSAPSPSGDFASGLRFGPHNLHENRAGSYRSERLVFVDLLQRRPAGLRPRRPGRAGRGRTLAAGAAGRAGRAADRTTSSSTPAA